jgi:hypothetical protein
VKYIGKKEYIIAMTLLDQCQKAHEETKIELEKCEDDLHLCIALGEDLTKCP